VADVTYHVALPCDGGVAAGGPAERQWIDCGSGSNILPHSFSRIEREVSCGE
jgi:hypothetical protein